MAASVRLLVRGLAHRSVTSAVAAGSCRSGGCLAPSSSRCISDTAEDRSTHFGFETVPEAEKAKRVYKVFENVAQKYDVMNDAMSLGVHRLWKDMLLHVMHPQPGARLLDVAGGTGDISFRFLDYVRYQQERQKRRAAGSIQTPSWQDISDKYPAEDRPQESRAVVCDINKEMLKVGKQRADSMGITSGLSWVVGDAEELPFDDDQFDIYTIAFGIRNVTHVDQALQEALRVLKPGGRFMCLEFSKVTNPILASLYDAYSFQVIPVLGEVIAGDWKSYQYLVESIRKFPDQLSEDMFASVNKNPVGEATVRLHAIPNPSGSFEVLAQHNPNLKQEEFKGMIEDAGFCCVQYFNFTGGVVALHSGFKL